MLTQEQCFEKIRLLNSMAGQIAAFGEQCGASGLMDYVDMNCGGIPEGEYSQVVDQTAPDQFLAMYRKVAENRFTFAVNALLKSNPAFMKPIEEFCMRTGREMQLPPFHDEEAARNAVDAYWFTDMSDVWIKAGGTSGAYWRLFQCFVDGLLEAGGFRCEIHDNTSFNLVRG